VDQETGRVAMMVRTEPGRANAVRERFAGATPSVSSS